MFVFCIFCVSSVGSRQVQHCNPFSYSIRTSFFTGTPPPPKTINARDGAVLGLFTFIVNPLGVNCTRSTSDIPDEDDGKMKAPPASPASIRPPEAGVPPPPASRLRSNRLRTSKHGAAWYQNLTTIAAVVLCPLRSCGRVEVHGLYDNGSAALTNNGCLPPPPPPPVSPRPPVARFVLSPPLREALGLNDRVDTKAVLVRFAP